MADIPSDMGEPGAPPAGPMDGDGAARRRPRRWLRWLLGSLALAVLALALAVWALLASLDRAPVKGWLTDLVRERFGLTLDYETADLGLGGSLSLGGLVVRSPPPWDAYRPDLLRVGRVALKVQLTSLLSDVIVVESVALDDVALRVVRDEAGGSSLADVLAAIPVTAPPEPLEPQPVVPTSALLALADLPLEIRVGQLALTGIEAELVDLRGGRVVGGTVLTGLEATGSAHMRPRATEARLALTSPASGTRFAQRAGDTERAATVTLQLNAEVAPDESGGAEVTLTAHASVREQSFHPALPSPGEALKLAATARFQPERQQVALEIRELAVFGDALTARLDTALLDGVTLPPTTSGVVTLDLPDSPAVAALLAELGAPELSGVTARAELEAVGAAPRGAVTLTGAAKHVGLDLDGRRVDATGVGLRVRAVATAPWHFDIDGSSQIEGVTTTEGTLGGIALTVDAKEFAVDPKRPAAVSGPLHAVATVARALLVEGEHEARLTQLSAELTTRLDAGVPGASSAELRVTAERLRGPEANLKPLDGASWVVRADDVRPVLANPLKSTGRVDATLTHPALSVRASLKKDAPDAAFVELHTMAAHLGPLLPLLPAGTTAGLPLRLEPLGVDLGLEGQLDGLSHPADATADLRLSGQLSDVEIADPNLQLATPTARLSGAVKGGLHDASATLALILVRPRLHGRPSASDLTLDLAGHLRAAPFAADATASLEGAGLPTAHLEATLARPTKTSGHSYTLSLDIRQLDRLARLLPPTATPLPAINAARVQVEARGSLGRKLGSLQGTHHGTLKTDALSTLLDGAPLAISDATVGWDVTLRGPGLLAAVSLQAARASASFGDQPLVVSAFSAELAADGPLSPARGLLTVTLDARAASVEQALLAGYVVADPVVRVRASLDRLTHLKIDELHVENPGGGTDITLSGELAGLDVRRGIGAGLHALTVQGVPGRRGMTLTARVRQDLDRAKTLTAALGVTSSGKLDVPVTLVSGDMRVFRVFGSVRPDAVDISVPGADLELRGLDGALAFDQTLEINADRRVRVLPIHAENTFAAARFQDMHVFLSDSYLTAELVRVGELRVGPLAGNVSVERNELRIDQLQAAASGGQVSGELIYRHEPPASLATFRGRLTGVKIGADQDPLDANAAVEFSPERLELSGRIHLLRLSKGHLREGLDLIDPYRADPDINLIRHLLALGYPKSAWVRMAGGFLSASVELGGVASLAKLSELRGVALGPLMQRYVAPILDPGDPR